MSLLLLRNRSQAVARMRPEDQLSPSVRAVLDGLPCSVTLPAGTGKTELIAAVVSEVSKQDGTALVLTHTHAGVDALRRRMRKFGVAKDRVVVRTIDAWCFDLIRHFPQLAGLEVPEAPVWADSCAYHQAAARAVGTHAVRRMLSVSYQVVLVDEYQDCLIDQHNVILGVARAVPTAVFGDPLQGLFDFGTNRPVQWGSDVLAAFPDMAVDYRPWRWQHDNSELGDWLLSIREALQTGQPVDLVGAPVKWVQADGLQTQNSVCFGAPIDDGSVAALGRFRPDCVTVASRLQGTYAVMEALDEKATSTFCALVDHSGPPALASGVVQFAVNCATGVAVHLPAALRTRLASSKPIGTRKPELQATFDAVNRILSSPSPGTVRAALQTITRLPGVTVYCREAWREALAALQHATLDPRLSVVEALAKVRNHARTTGRRSEPRIVTRPLLAKGLEYKHVVLLDADQYTAVELYVALTRGSKSVTVISKSPQITPRDSRR
jgi:hypothetical protein